TRRGCCRERRASGPRCRAGLARRAEETGRRTGRPAAGERSPPHAAGPAATGRTRRVRPGAASRDGTTGHSGHEASVTPLWERNQPCGECQTCWRRCSPRPRRRGSSFSFQTVARSLETRSDARSLAEKWVVSESARNDLFQAPTVLGLVATPLFL